MKYVPFKQNQMLVKKANAGVMKMQFASINGWTLQIYRQYQRIKTELKERCKEAYNKSWEDKITFHKTVKIVNNFGIKLRS